MKVYQPHEIKNIALLGSAKSGKTTLAECMLFEGGIITRRGTVEDKNTVSDYREIELDRQSSVYQTVMHTDWRGNKINIIDTPGIDDFIGEAISALNVVETALVVINAQNGVEPGTEIIWRYVNKLEKPTIFVINQLDHEKANFEDTYNQLKQDISDKAILIQYPIKTGNGFNCIIDLLRNVMYKFPATGGKPEKLAIPDSEKEKAEELRAKLIEAAAENDDKLMEVYFEKGTLEEADLVKGLKLSIKNRSIYPVFSVCAKHNMGSGRLMGFINEIAPAAGDYNSRPTKDGKTLPINSQAPANIFVFKSAVEQHLGEISFFKVYTGEVKEGSDLTNTTNSGKERLNQLFVIDGKNRNKIEKLCAGDIGATIKLKDTKTGHTLSEKGDIVFGDISYPEPKTRMAVAAKNQNDEEKLVTILNQIHNSDHTFLIEFSKELKQIVVQGQGELHLSVTKWILENINKIPIDYIAPRIQYRETITKTAKAMYRHKKQSGGAGQFGEVHILIEPYYEGKPNQTEFPVRGTEEKVMPWGGKLVFNNCIVGGAIDARFLPAIMKGILDKMEEGPLTGSYARDIVVNVYDGKMHPVDSNEMSFKLAGRNAFKEAFKNAGPKILEQIYDVEVIEPEDKTGDVMTDLQGRRAMIMGIEGEGRYQRIKARVPLAEMNRYSTALSSLTSGRATYTMKYAEYVQVPSEVQNQLLKEYEAQEKEEE